MTAEALIAFENKLIHREANNTDVSDVSSAVHHRLISSLIQSYIAGKFDNADSIMEICFDKDAATYDIPTVTDPDKIPALCEELHIAFLNSKFQTEADGSISRKKSKERLAETGAFYTLPSIAGEIVRTAAANCAKNPDSSKILDFACGTGRFYEKIAEIYSDARSAALNNIYAIDIDIDALMITRMKALAFFERIDDDECRRISRHIVLRNALYTSTEDSFPGDTSAGIFGPEANGGFDIIVSNPPYRVLKPNKSKSSLADVAKIKSQLAYFRNCGSYIHSTEGMLNLYQLSIERMIQMLRTGGELGVICPSTLFADKSASRLRKYLLLHNTVRSIRFFAEKTPLFENVSQATNIFFIKKGGQTDCIQLRKDQDCFTVRLKQLCELFPEKMEIPAISSVEWNILHKLSVFPKLKDIPGLRNRRGELDLTLCKKYITSWKTPYRLIRGNMISDGEIKDINHEYVDRRFISSRSADFRNHDFKRRRLICQQISNGGQRRRLKFTFCAKYDILGNSCNYLSADEETLKKLSLLLNSSLLNWRFKITSSNNHINNYELDELPIADLKEVDPSFHYSTQEELDNYISSLYGLSVEEKEQIEK